METYTLFRIFLTVMSLGVAASVVAGEFLVAGVAAAMTVLGTLGMVLVLRWDQGREGENENEDGDDASAD